MKEYKVKRIELNGDRRLIYRVKKAGIETMNPLGEWNGYGYERLPMVAVIKTLGEMRKFNKIKRELDQIPKRPPKTQEEKIKSWAKRLVKLLGDDYELTLEEAEEIAWEKLNYKTEQINKMIDRQNELYSRKREKLINKMYRSNPLRYIKDEHHAIAIINAHDRHTSTNYDYYLSEAHELEECGEIEKGRAREYALDMINDRSDKWDWLR